MFNFISQVDTLKTERNETLRRGTIDPLRATPVPGYICMKHNVS